MSNDTARAVAATLRYLAGSMVVPAEAGYERKRALDEQNWLVNKADELEVCSPAEWDCCPLCEETKCDTYCPLAVYSPLRVGT